MEIENMYVDKEGLWYSEEDEMVRVPVKLNANGETIWTEIGYSYFPKREYKLADIHIKLGQMRQEELVKLIQEEDSFMKARDAIEKFATEKSKGNIKEDVKIVSCDKKSNGFIEIVFKLGNEEGTAIFEKCTREGLSPSSLEVLSKPYMGFTEDVFQLIAERVRLYLLLQA